LGGRNVRDRDGAGKPGPDIISGLGSCFDEALTLEKAIGLENRCHADPFLGAHFPDRGNAFPGTIGPGFNHPGDMICNLFIQSAASVFIQGHGLFFFEGFEKEYTWLGIIPVQLKKKQIVMATKKQI
jgi:hypothetical protein